MYLDGELRGASGVPDGHALTRAAWPERDDVVALDLPGLPTGAWDEPPLSALVVPFPQQDGFLVAGLNRYRQLDDDYRAFLGLAAGQIAAVRGRARPRGGAGRARPRQDRVLHQVSHELRTPLTLLLGPAEDALTEPLEDVQRHRVEVITRNAQRLLKLVNTLLDFSRLESGRVSAYYEPVDLSRYTAELASMFESAVERAGLALETDCPPLPEPVYVDREMWAKIVLNLVSNALKFTFAGAIGVRVETADGAARLTVTDTGIGIDEADQARLFERFHRVAGARSRSREGSGIGLALVAELAELHGGQAAVASVRGQGSRFSVVMPFGDGHLPADQVSGESERDVSVRQQAEGFLVEAMRWLGAEDGDGSAIVDGPRVLVVDDNADMRGYIASPVAGRYAVETAADGAVALERARANPPDLVLTDVMMPNLDGFGLLKALQEDPGTTGVPVIMLSARGRGGHDRKARGRRRRLPDQAASACTPAHATNLTSAEVLSGHRAPAGSAGSRSTASSASQAA